jgi:hypothetical protein
MSAPPQVRKSALSQPLPGSAAVKDGGGHWVFDNLGTGQYGASFLHLFSRGTFCRVGTFKIRTALRCRTS